jgi:hypothetical protein
MNCFKNNMSYEKCFNCSHSNKIYLSRGSYGLLIICRITGQEIKIIECLKAGDNND